MILVFAFSYIFALKHPGSALLVSRLLYLNVNISFHSISRSWTVVNLEDDGPPAEKCLIYSQNPPLRHIPITAQARNPVSVHVEIHRRTTQA